VPAVGAGPSPNTPFVPRRRRRRNASPFGPASNRGVHREQRLAARAGRKEHRATVRTARRVARQKRPGIHAIRAAAKALPILAQPEARAIGHRLIQQLPQPEWTRTPGAPPLGLFPYAKTTGDVHKLLRYTRRAAAARHDVRGEIKFKQPSDLSRAIDVGLTVAPVGLVARSAKGAYDVARAVRASADVAEGGRAASAAGRLAKATEEATARGRAAAGVSKAAKAARASRPARAISDAARTVGDARAARVTGKLAAKAGKQGAVATGRATRAGFAIGAAAPPANQGGNPFQVPLTNVEALGKALNPVGGHLTRTAEATGKAAIGFAVTPVEIAANVGLSAGRAGSTGLHDVGVPGFKGYSGHDIAYPTVTQVKQLEAFGKDVVNKFGSGDVDKIQKAIEQDYGITLPLSAVPGFAKLTERGRGRAVAAIRRHGITGRGGELGRARFQARYAEEVRRAEQENRPIDPKLERQNQRKGQRLPPGEEPQPVFRRTAARRQRHGAAREHGVTEARIAGTRHNLVREFEKLRRKVPGRRGVRGSTEIHPEDLAATLAARGIPRDREAGMAEVAHLDRQLGRRHVPATELYQAQIIRHVARNPDLVWGEGAKPLWELVDRFKKGAAKVTRHGPASRARYIPIARAHGIPLPEELVPRRRRAHGPVAGRREREAGAHHGGRGPRQGGRTASPACQDRGLAREGVRREAVRNARYERPQLTRTTERSMPSSAAMRSRSVGVAAGPLRPRARRSRAHGRNPQGPVTRDEARDRKRRLERYRCVAPGRGAWLRQRPARLRITANSPLTSERAKGWTAEARTLRDARRQTASPAQRPIAS
jgi:hypothetical protein